MSQKLALGQKRTSIAAVLMSALCQADELHCSNRPLFDHLVGAAITQRLRSIRSDRNSSRHALPKSPRMSMVFLLIISRNSTNVLFGSRYILAIFCPICSALARTFGDDSTRILPIFP